MFSGFFHETSMEYPLVFHARKSCGSDGTSNEEVKHHNFTDVLKHCTMTSFTTRIVQGSNFLSEWRLCYLSLAEMANFLILRVKLNGFW